MKIAVYPGTFDPITYGHIDVIKKSLNILCRGAAMRYLLTRLYDYSNTPKTALIKIKDPNEYYQKLITHNNLKSYKDYLN